MSWRRWPLGVLVATGIISGICRAAELPDVSPFRREADGSVRELPADSFLLRLADLRLLPTLVQPVVEPTIDPQGKTPEELRALERQRAQAKAIHEQRQKRLPMWVRYGQGSPMQWLRQLPPAELDALILELIYSRQFEHAIHVLMPLSRAGDRAAAVRMKQLALVFAMQEEYERAARQLEAAVEIEGKIEATDWRRQVERTYLLRLLHQRQRETRRGSFRETEAGLDDLFGVRYVGESGQFEPGTLAAEQKAKLPVDALAVVQQLLLWLPSDRRLYWQLGELYNAQGDLRRAEAIFDNCRFAMELRHPLLDRHHQMVRERLEQISAEKQARREAERQAAEAEIEADRAKTRERMTYLLPLMLPLAGVLLLLQLREWRRRWRGLVERGCCGR